MKIARVRRFALVLLGLIVITPFQNCGKPMRAISNVDASSSSAPASDNTGSVSGTDPSSGTSSTIQAYQALRTQSLNIISNRCGACHVSASLGGIGQLTDVNHLISSGIVVVGDPAQSSLVTSITGGTMPPGTTLPATEVQALQDWISSMSMVSSP